MNITTGPIGAGAKTLNMNLFTACHQATTLETIVTRLTGQITLTPEEVGEVVKLLLPVHERLKRISGCLANINKKVGIENVDIG